MKIKISYTVEVNDWFRRAINFRYGVLKPATREQIKNFYYLYGQTLDDNITNEYQTYLEEKESK
jgi:hypothetical protein